MGAYLYYKLVNKNQADSYNAYMSGTEEGKRLIKAKSFLYVNDKSDIEWAKAKPENNHWLGYYEKYQGQGDFKASGISDSEIFNAGCKDEMEYFELITNFFVKAQKKYKMKFAAWSCAFNPNESYFSISQMQRITNYGERLSGKDINLKKYEKLHDLLKRKE